MKSLLQSVPVQLEHLKRKTFFSLYGLEYPYQKLGYSSDKKHIICRRYITAKSYVNVKFPPNIMIESILINNDIIL